MGIIRDFEQLFDAAKKRTSTDRWIISMIADVKAIDLKYGEMSCNKYTSPDFPRFLQSSEEDLKKYAISKNVGVYLQIEDKSYPIDETCLEKIAGLAQAGSFITLLAKKAGQRPVTFAERASVLNLACECFTGSGEVGSKKAKFLFRDGHLCTALSEDYHVFPFDKFLEIASDECKNLDEEGQVRLISGELDEDIDVAEFRVRNSELEKKVATALGASKAHLYVKIASGDTGGCSISVYPMVSADGIITMFGSPTKIKHDSNRANAEDVRNTFSSIFASLRDTIESIEELKKRTVQYPGGMFLRLAKAASLPKRDALAMAGSMDEHPQMFSNQYTVWWALTQLLNIWARDNKPTQIALSCKQEAIFRLLTTNKGKFDSEDAPYNWEASKID